MEDFEKNLRDKFKDATSNEGIDANDLWNSIAPEINDDTPVTPPIDGSINGFKKFLPLLLLLFIALSGLFFFHFKDDTTTLSTPSKNNISTEKTTQNQNAQKTLKNQNNSKPLNSTIKTVTTSTTNVETNTDLIEGAARTNNLEIKTSNNTAVRNEKMSTPNFNAVQIPTPQVDDTKEIKTNLANEQVTGTNLALNIDQERSTFISPSKIKPEQSTNIERVDAIVNKESIHSSEVVSEITDFNIEIKSSVENFDLLASKAFVFPLDMSNKNIAEFKPEEVKFDKSKAKFALGIYGGTHLLGEKFAGDQASEILRAEELNQAFKVFPGQHFGADFYFHFNEHLFASAGISWRKSISQFNLIIETKDSSFVRTDEFAGQIIKAEATRTIVHHNKLTSIGIPLSIGYQTSFGKWTIGTSAGLAINWTQKYSGRTLNERNQLISYPTNESDIVPAKAVYLSYQLNPFLNYSVNNKLAIQLRTSIRLSQFGKTSLYDIKHSGLSSGVGFGLIYTP